MKKLFKRSAIALVLVLTMIAAFSMVVSATTTPTGPIASVTVNGGTATEYNDFDTLYAAMNRVGGDVVVTVYQDITFERAVVALDKLTIKAADGLTETPTITVKLSKPSKNNGSNSTPYKGGFVFASASNKITLKDLNFVVEATTLSADATKGTTSLVMFNSTTEATALATDHKHELVLDNVNVTSAGAVINQYAGGEFSRAYITVNGGSFTATGDFIEASRSTKAEKFAFNLTVTGDATFAVAKFYSTPLTNNPTEACFITYANDATAKAAGMAFRVGETATGNEGKVYFKTKDEALLKGEAGQKVYDITGTELVEVATICAHEFSETVVAPTCDEQGYTEMKCSKCDLSRKDNYVEALGHEYSKATCTAKAKCSKCNEETGELARHKYAAATCTKKAACSVCGVERGELAKHVDLDKNDKCDKCDAKMSVEEVTTTAPATEEKKGCKGTVSVAGLALVAALGSCALFVEKKRK